ncbi:MAG: hypothetical protein LC802_08520 [Acidobacteria bacterium]|nr:hypothetical protein [Acidobacteriota bacterium]
MAIKRRKSRHAHGSEGRKKHVEELSGRLAPLEEQKAFSHSEQSEGNHNHDDTIRVDSNSVKMPQQFSDGERDAAGIFYLEPVVIFIIALMLCFIAFIAWQITLMPQK